MSGRERYGQVQAVTNEMFDDVGRTHTGTRQYKKIGSVSQKNQEQNI